MNFGSRINAAIFSLFAGSACYGAEIDILMLYSSKAEGPIASSNKDIASMSDYYSQRFNQVFANSGVNLTARVVGTLPYDPRNVNANKVDIVNEIQKSNYIKELRGDYGADFVMMLTQTKSKPNDCGWGFTADFSASEHAFSIVEVSCGYVGAIHELGHNFGLYHNEGDVPLRYDYGRGYGQDFSFATIMSAPGAGDFELSNSNQFVPVFSNPDLNICNNGPCGIPVGRPGARDARRAINLHVNDFKNYRPTKIAHADHHEHLRQNIQKMYIAYYGRPADPSGMDWWLTKLVQAGGDMRGIVDHFGNSEEFYSRFGHLSNEQLVDNLYQQLFGRNADPVGRAFYANELATGAQTLASIALSIADGAGSQSSDGRALANKMAVANYFTKLLRQTGSNYYQLNTIPAVVAELKKVTHSMPSVHGPRRNLMRAAKPAKYN